MGKDIRSRGETGATLVEAAIILPVLILLVVTIMELGLAFKDFLTTDFAAKEGARVGALAGNDIMADCDIIQSVVAGYSA
ncbi:MAG: TadE family protein, partial [Acidimicrobiia bacterium]